MTCRGETLASEFRPVFLGSRHQRDRYGTKPRALVVVAPGEVGRLFRHLDRTQMVTLRIPHPDSPGTGHKQISVVVDFNAVRYSVVLCARLLTENSAVAQGAVWGHVIHADVSLLTVIHVEALAIGREGKPVGLCEVFGQEADISFFVQAVHALERYFLLLSFHQIERGIGEVESTVGTDHDIIRTVEFLSLILVSQYGVFPVRSYRDDGAQNAGAIDQTMLPVVGIAIGIAERDHFLFAAVFLSAVQKHA